MEKIIVGKWYRHRGNKNSVPERVRNGFKKYALVVRHRNGWVVAISYYAILSEPLWAHLGAKHKYGFGDIMAYKFVEKK